MTMNDILSPLRPYASPTSSTFPSVGYNLGPASEGGRTGAQPLHALAEGVGSSGLVYSETSVTETHAKPVFIEIEVNPQEARLRRLRRSVLTAARLHCQERSKWRVAMLTLTYAPEHDWAPFQITGLIRSIRQYLKRKNISTRFVWVQEFTKKGRPHYHLLLWLPYGFKVPMPDKRGWWPYGMTKFEWAKNAIGYIAKYASKGDSLHQPAPGARMHGNGGLTGDALLEQRWWRLPAWCRELVTAADGCKRIKGGGMLIPETGEILKTPWTVSFRGGKVYIWKEAAPCVQ